MAKEAKLKCPNCGTVVTVYEDEVGEAGTCPGCGGDLEVFRRDFGEGDGGARKGRKNSLAARVAKLVSRPSESRETDAGEAEDAGPAEQDEQDEARADDEEAVLAGLLDEDAEGLAAAEEALLSSGSEKAAERQETPAAEPLGADIEYRLWQGVAEQGGDRAMAARLDLWLRAEQAGCAMTLTLPAGVDVPVPQMVLAEAAAAQSAGATEHAWRDGWTRRLLQMAAQWPDEQTTEGVVAVLNHTDAVVGRLKEAHVWPWALQDEPS